MIDRLGDFVIKHELAVGGMGTVYLAWQTSLQRDVVIKVLNQQYAQDRNFIARFQHEARAAARLQHPNIVQIYFVGEEAGYHYFAMEYIEGENLKTYVREKIRLSVVESLDIIIKTADALACAGAAGIIHRDIKPENIMVTPQGRVKVTDFGLAKSLSVTTGFTQAGKILGTVNYMAPEQGLGQDVDSRSDIYSLGVVFFELLAGRPPFKGDHPTSVIYMHVYEPPPPIRKINRSVPGEIEELILHMMSKNPEDRPQSVPELLQKLEHIRETCHLSAAGSAGRRTMAPSDPASPTAFQAPVFNPAKRQCLIVEPSGDVSDELIAQLAELGFSVLVADDGLQGLEMWQQISPAVVLMDLELPKLCGMALLEERRTRGLSGEVFITSACRDWSVIHRTADFGVAGYLLKPFNVESVITRIRRSLHAISDTTTRIEPRHAVKPVD